jgi:hypothetical protein
MYVARSIRGVISYRLLVWCHFGFNTVELRIVGVRSSTKQPETVTDRIFDIIQNKLQKNHMIYIRMRDTEARATGVVVFICSLHVSCRVVLCFVCDGAFTVNNIQ